jgi:glucose-6-phosphate isomerase
MLSRADLLDRQPRLEVRRRHERLHGRVHVTPGPLGAQVARLLESSAGAAMRLWRRDASLWTADAAEQAHIGRRLGWLDAPALMADSLDRLTRFADLARIDGFTHAVLLGMGGSSLAPEVLRAVLGSKPSWLQLHVLDSTDPAAILAIDTPARQTLVIVASKSGTTIEPMSLAAAFEKRLADAGVPDWASHFVAITDADTALARQARTRHFREVFINPSDIGGRYSALSFFGLVPASLMGQDISALVGWGLAELAGIAPAPADAPGGDEVSGAVALGTVLAAGARHGRDKMTLLVPPALAPFGLWVEQLVAESTGKRGVGIVPIAGERPADPARYGSDRLFVRIDPRDGSPRVDDSLVAGLRRAGHPIVDIELPEGDALGAEFVRWEIATAIAAALLDINPFDEPNVAQAKEATGRLLGEFKAHGRLPTPPPDVVLPNGVGLRATRAHAGGAAAVPSAILGGLRAGDYFGLLAYIGPHPDLAHELHALRMAVRDAVGVATTFGYGPRYLHSTGQLHKGGPNNGVFVIVTATPASDLEIPGEGISFGTLELAQALGDFASLDALGRRALHVHLPRPDARLVAAVAATLLEHARPLRP